MNKFDISKVQKRAVSASVLAPLVLWMIYYGGWPFVFLVVFCASLSLFEWVQLSLKAQQKIVFLFIGLIYISLSFWSCYLLRIEYSFKIALFFILMVWSSDIGAYFAGKFFGGPKMAVTISPNKTWAGYAGALLSPALLAVLYQVFLMPGAMSEWIMVAVAAGIVIGVVGQAGDLLISWFKRHVGVKDTGQLIPGHGGLLDRIDSMLLAAPVFLFIVTHFSYVFI